MKKSIIIVIAITVIAIIIYGVRSCSISAEILVAKAEIKEEKISAEGTIVYHEVVYSAENDGTFYSYVEEGERVAKDSAVATVYDGVVDKDILQSLNNIDKKITEIENGNNSIYVTDESSTQVMIENTRTDIINAVIEKDVSKINEYKNKLEIATGVKEVTEAGESLVDLKKEKREIEEKIKSKKKDISSDIAGIYTTAIDGLEGVITPGKIEEYTVDDYHKLDNPEDRIIGNRTVKSGDKVCKVVDNHEWYVVCVVGERDKKRLKIGDDVKLRVEKLPGMDVDATVTSISAESENSREFLVSVKCDQYLEGVFNIRKSKVEIVLNSFYGYEVPVYAIHVKDEKHGVMVMGNEREIFKECNILHRNNETGMVIIEPSQTGNRLIDGDQIIIGEK